MGINNPSGGGGGNMTLLHDETLAATGRFDVSGLTANHIHLELWLLARTDQAVASDVIYLFFNGDETVANYDFGGHHAGSTHGITSTATPRVAVFPGASAGADRFGLTKVHIPRYTFTHAKFARTISGAHSGGTIYARKQLVAWDDVAAITQITLQPDGYPTDEFIIGSSLQIYGVGSA